MSGEEQWAWQVIDEVEKAVVGKREILTKIMTAILAGGHILIEDIPGTGKTTMALAFSRAMGLEVKRVQFTPDVLPSDLTGFYDLSERDRAVCLSAGSSDVQSAACG